MDLKYYYNEWIRIPIRNFRVGILNLFRWLPIVWRDRDWDKHYIMEVLIFKLKKNRQYSIDHGHVVNDEQIRTMTECIELLEKVHNEFDNYEEPAYLKHQEKWGKTEHYFVPCEDRPDMYELKDRNDERYTEEEVKQKNHEFIISSRIAHQKRQRDFEVAMEIFVSNFDSWWD
jgi:hypothetical protein